LRLLWYRQSLLDPVRFNLARAVGLENSAFEIDSTSGLLIDPDLIQPRGLDFESGQQRCVGRRLDRDRSQFDLALRHTRDRRGGAASRAGSSR